jgi:hypothetical protein
MSRWAPAEMVCPDESTSRSPSSCFEVADDRRHSDQSRQPRLLVGSDVRLIGRESGKKSRCDEPGEEAVIPSGAQVLGITQEDPGLGKYRTVYRCAVHGCPPSSDPRTGIDSALQAFVTYSFSRFRAPPCLSGLPGSVALSTLLGLMPRRPFAPLGRAISSR